MDFGLSPLILALLKDLRPKAKGRKSKVQSLRDKFPQLLWKTLWIFCCNAAIDLLLLGFLQNAHSSGVTVNSSQTLVCMHETESLSGKSRACLNTDCSCSFRQQHECLHQAIAKRGGVLISVFLCVNLGDFCVSAVRIRGKHSPRETPRPRVRHLLMVQRSQISRVA